MMAAVVRSGVLVPPRGGARREVSILALIEWAFQRELVGLNLSRRSDAVSGYGYASMTHAIIQHEQLGCRVDGGGSSPAHPDADAVADALVSLPESVGGVRMALWVAELARAGQQPDWCPEPRPSCRPVDWRQSKHGCYAKTERAGDISYVYRGRVRTFEVRYCPVTYTDSAQDVGRARRRWLQWWSALLELRQTFQVYGGLSAFVVNDVMPPLRPWEGVEPKSLDG